MDTEKSQQQSRRSSTSPAKPRKFRSSCDACSASKVKCGQEQPRCLRCTNLGLSCHYSPSRRMGKPPASSRKIANASDLSASETEKQNIPHPAKKRQISVSSSSPASFISDTQVQAPTSSQDQCVLDPPLMDTEDFMTMQWQDIISQHSAFDGPATTDAIQYNTANLFDLNLNFIGDSTQPTDNNRFVFGDEDMQSNSPPSRNSTYEPCPQYSPRSSQSSIGKSPLRASIPKLCTHQLGINLNLPLSPLCQRSFDQVLIKNKTAIEDAYTLLSCPCSQDPQFAFTLAVICNKILAKYEAVINAPLSETSSSGSGDSDCSNVARIPITVGAYRMDAEDEERMRMQILINELRKVKSLVDKYGSKYCASSDGDMGDIGAEIYSALEGVLRSKLTTMLQDLVTRLES